MTTDHRVGPCGVDDVMRFHPVLSMVVLTCATTTLSACDGAGKDTGGDEIVLTAEMVEALDAGGAFGCGDFLVVVPPTQSLEDPDPPLEAFLLVAYPGLVRQAWKAKGEVTLEVDLAEEPSALQVWVDDAGDWGMMCSDSSVYPIVTYRAQEGMLGLTMTWTGGYCGKSKDCAEVDVVVTDAVVQHDGDQVLLPDMEIVDVRVGDSVGP